MVGNPNVSEHSEHFPDMYRLFKMVDQSVLQQLNEYIEEIIKFETRNEKGFQLLDWSNQYGFNVHK